MSERIAYLNGRFVAESEAKVSILDRGFLFGDSVYDSSRTFNEVPWRMRSHIQRLQDSCCYARLDPGMDVDQMDTLSQTLVEKNADAYASDEEFRINHWVTRGGGARYSGARDGPHSFRPADRRRGVPYRQYHLHTAGAFHRWRAHATRRPGPAYPSADRAMDRSGRLRLARESNSSSESPLTQHW